MGSSSSSSSSSNKHASKKRLKALINVHKLVELVAAASSFVRLLLVPADDGLDVTPREYHIGRLLHSVLFILHCQAVTKFSWDESAGRPLASYQHPQQQQRQQQQQRPPPFGPATASPPYYYNTAAAATPKSSSPY